MEQTGRRGLTRRQLVSPAALLATLAISLAFGYFALRGIRFSATWDALGASNYWWLVPSLGALATSVQVRVIRWQTLFDPTRRPPLGSLTKATYIGLFFNSILPLRAGEIARIVALKRYAGTSRAETAGTVVVERLFDVSSLIVLLFAMLPWLPHVSWLKPAAIVAFAALAFVLALILFVRLASDRSTPLGARLLTRIPGLSEQTVSRLTGNVLRGLATLSRPRQALAALGWTFLSWFLLGLSYWFVMMCFDLGLSPLAGLLVVIATGLAFIIPSAPAAVGVFEAAGLVVTSAYDVPRSQALAYVLVLHVVNFAPFVIVGVLLLARDARASRLSTAPAARLRSRV
jgi:glycosyltransferase 2 family protein